MSASAEHKVDRDGWPAGPWDSEPDRLEWRDERAVPVLPCIIVRNDLGGLCGYVGVPAGHPWHGKDYDGQGVVADVHGGLTYANECAGHVCHAPRPGESDDTWWLGFDCVHSGDLAPGMMRYRSGGSVRGDSYRDVTYVRAEIARLADQARAVCK